ncbi:hypothetical protein [Nostoc sp.]|uniref:hypothetical protein n=1 Tax=Nostoc sp. TaxID=1180 RepID=UPI002FFC94A0
MKMGNGFRGVQWQAQQFRVNLSIGVWIRDRPVAGFVQPLQKISDRRPLPRIGPALRYF